MLNKSALLAIVTALPLLCCETGLCAEHKGKTLFDFEEGKLSVFETVFGEGGTVSNRRMLYNESRTINKQGDYFISTLDAETGNADDTMQTVLESELFNVDMPYLSFMMGGGVSENAYIEIVSEDEEKAIRVTNSVATQNMFRVGVDVKSLMGARAFIRIVDMSSDYYGFILADDFMLTASEEDAEAGGTSSVLFYSDFSDGIIPASMKNTDSWFVGPDPDNNLCLQTKNIGGMSTLITVGDESWDDYSVKFTVKALKLGSGAAVHANFRMQGDEKNCYRVVITANGNVAVRLVKDGAYGDSTICSGMIADINSENTIEIKASSALIELYINGVKCGEGSNNTYTSGPVSFGTWAMLGAFDNIEIKRAEKVVNVESIALPYKNLDLKIGDTLVIEPQIMPEDATVKTVKYISRNLNAVTITPDGVLRAVDEGEALIVVRTNDGNYEAQCNVTVSGKSFDDIKNHWAKEDIEVLAAQGVISGRTDTMFAPDDNIINKEALILAGRMSDGFKSAYILDDAAATTREQFFAIAGELYKRMTGLSDTVGDASEFSDKPSLEYANDIAVLCGLKILEGDENGKLNPNKNVTRAEAARVLKMLLDRSKYNESGIYKSDYTVGFGLRGDKHFKVYEPGDDVIYFVRADGADGGSVEIRLTDKQSGEVKKEKIAINGNLFETERLFVPEKNGVYSIEFTYINPDGLAEDEQSMQIGVIPKALKTADDTFYFGIQPHISFAYTRPHWDHNFEGLCYNETFDLSFDLMEWIGTNVIREGTAIIVDKEEAKKPADEWGWEFSDDVVKRIAENGMTYDLILNNRGTEIKDEYKNANASWDAIPKTTESILDVTGKIMDRYEGAKILYEFGNESNYPSYNAGTEAEYVEQLEAFAKYIKKRDPNIPVSSAGIVVDGPKDENIYYQGISKLRNQGYIDIFAYHSHGDFNTYLKNIKQVKAFADNAKLDINQIAFLNETGLDIADKKEQVSQVIRKLLCAFGNNNKGVVAFKLRQYPEIASPGGMGGYAMIGNRGDVRELYIGYGALISMLDGAKSVKQIENNGVFAYSFVKDDCEIVAVFAEDNVKGKTISVANDDFVVYNIYGNEMEKVEQYEIGKEPLYIKLKSSDNIVLNK